MIINVQICIDAVTLGSRQGVWRPVTLQRTDAKRWYSDFDTMALNKTVYEDVPADMWREEQKRQKKAEESPENALTY